MKKDILIFPYCGTGIESLDCLGDIYNCVGFISDNRDHIGKKYAEIKIFDRQALYDFPTAKVLAVPGNPLNFHNRKDVIDGLQVNEERFVTVIHPNAFVSAHAQIGKNVLIMAFVNLGPNTSVGDHICILPNSSIHHDSVIKNYTLIGGNVLVAGNVIIEENCYIGAGSNIINGCSIGEKSMIGLGSNVIHNISAHKKVAGNPAKEI